MAGTAGSDPQKQFLTLIRSFAAEKSQGERRVVGLKKRIEELRSELEATNAELEVVKRAKETTEQELKGYEVELALSETSIQSLKSRVSLIQDEISTVGSDLEALKNNEGALRDEFISQMLELNTKIRKFQETFACNFRKDCSLKTVAEEGYKPAGKEPNEFALTTLEDMMAHVISQITKEEEEYKSEQEIQKLTQKEFGDCEKKVSLIEVIMKTTRTLQDLTRYPY
ncbi:spindle assembly checkpoint component [Parasponia andersonii]|uniref:Spindle assembly checkpoint component n=1 Tax=Parasponia andersonii TaxID=3476 RepID=A0A2P5CEK3_PARAD|nr:spindle assembly checkpoint component [Parasponia andersonii]